MKEGIPITRWFARRTAISLAAILMVFICVAGFIRLPSTDAVWSDDYTGNGTFRAGSIEQLNVSCTSSNTLTTTAVTLSWDPPEGLEDEEIIYEVQYQGVGLLAGIDRTITTTDLSYSYRRGLLSSLLQFGMNFTVTPKLEGTQWTGDSTSVSAKGIVLIGGLGVLKC